MESNISTTRSVYVISYDSKINEGERIYLRTNPKRTGVANIQDARRFSTLDIAMQEAAKLKFGNPRIERHATCIAEDVIAVFDSTGAPIK